MTQVIPPVIPPMDSTSTNIVADNINKLKELFPEAFTEGKVDFDALKEVLGEYVDGRDERYSFTWNGKSKARMIAQTPSTGTLRPCKEESVDWDSTQNLFIEGDNLEVLKLLQKSYHKKVKMIYIDPPYNTGNDFVYKDNFKDNIKNYKEITGQVDGEGRSLSNNPETSGRYHTDWLNMMYPRLKLARNLLKDDGVIFISIDGGEFTNLKKICDEIFGEENFISDITRISKTTSFRGNFIAPGKDSILCYAKSLENTERFIDEVDVTQYKKIETTGDRVGEYYRDDIAFYLTTLETRPNQRYFVTCPDGQKVIPPGGTFPPEKPQDGDGVWRWSLESFKEKESYIVFKESNQSPLIDENGNKARWNLYTKSYLKEKMEKGNLPRDLWDNFLNRSGTKELKELDIPFSFPKPTALITKMLRIIQSKSDDLILDFFAGSGTSAHAVFRQNSLDNEHRKFILVQLPELCEEKSEAYRTGYRRITEISKERIRRAAAKIQAENPDYNGDLGFKVFKLDSTNIKPWELDFDLTEQDLEDQISNIKTDRKEEDVLYEVLLKYGLDLTLPITEHSIDGHKVFNIGMGALIVCLSDKISLEVAEGIAKLKEELNPEIMRVVFKDAGFADDVVKTNALQILKQAGIEDVRSL